MSVERIERKDGSVVWRVRWRQAGQNRSKVLGPQARRRGLRRRAPPQARTGELAPLDAGKETLAEFGEEWWRLYAEPNLAASTLQVYAILWDTHVLPRLGVAAAARAHAAIVTRFRLELEAEGVGPASIRKALTLLQGVLQRAVRVGPPRRPTRSPRCASRRPAAPAPSSRSRPTPSRRSARGCSAPSSVRDATLVSVLAYAGLRPGEALALTGRTSASARCSSRRRCRSARSSEHEDAPAADGAAAPRRSAHDLAEWRLRAGRPTASRARLPGPRRRPVDADGVPELASPDLRPAAAAAGLERRAPVRPAPLVRLAADRRGPQRRRGRPPGRPLAEDGARHLRARLRGVRPGASASTPPSASARRARSCASARGSRPCSTSRDRDARHLRRAAPAEGKLLRWGERAEKAACAMQPRDLEILARARALPVPDGRADRRAVLARPQPAAGAPALTRLFHAGLLERFRPQTLRGSYPWTYCLGERRARDPARQPGGSTPADVTARREQIFDYRYVIHDLRTTTGCSRYREQPRRPVARLGRNGRSSRRRRPGRARAASTWPPSGGPGRYQLACATSGHSPGPADAVIELDRREWEVPHMLLIEFDRTRRVDKNFEKFLRYDTFLLVWWNR